jgi:hypothetical protein
VQVPVSKAKTNTHYSICTQAYSRMAPLAYQAYIGRSRHVMTQVSKRNFYELLMKTQLLQILFVTLNPLL